MKVKILVVDQNRDSLDAMRVRLEQWGYEVHSAVNEIEFEEKAFTIEPDLLILDIMLGDKNAAHVYDHLIKKGFNNKIPVLFLSELANDRPESYAHPGRHYALHGKPFEPKKLHQEINMLVQSSE